ncbi:unnamed protein product [Spirodela intermedia]|uniref:Uncharacterized protein n=1 Tax=Spirodela intermedia TaxID=51605 RepID=A0A7I8LDQ9_SPIIN|nr:unnamed protein product [Spirodela intermedia]
MARQPQTRSLRQLRGGGATSPRGAAHRRSTQERIKSILEEHLFPGVIQVAGAFSKLRSAVAGLFGRRKDDRCDLKMRRRKRRKYFSTIQIGYGCSSSPVLPMAGHPSAIGVDPSHLYYDSTWNSVITTTCEEEVEYSVEPHLSGYLQWLEESQPENPAGEHDDPGEIDRLAERFIASCHEKFRLEKQESYRRYQEMLARSV